MFDKGQNFVFEVGLFVVVAICFFLALLPFAKQINDFILRYTVGQRNIIHEKLKEIYVDVSPQKLLNILIGFCSGMGVLVFAACLPNFVLGLILFPIVLVVSWFIPGLALRIYISKRIEKFNVQLIDALALMSASLRAGQSITQAMDLMVREMPDPISQEFEQVLKQNRLGVTLQESLENLAARIKSDECQMLVTSIVILEESGGNLPETFDTISTTIRERVKLEQKISAMIAAARTQGTFVFCIPVMILLMNYYTDPKSVLILVQSTIGLVISGVIFIIYITGGFLLWQVTKIRV